MPIPNHDKRDAGGMRAAVSSHVSSDGKHAGRLQAALLRGRYVHLAHELPIRVLMRVRCHAMEYLLMELRRIGRAVIRTDGRLGCMVAPGCALFPKYRPV